MTAMILAGLLMTLAAPVMAQRNEATLEASVFRGALGYARELSPRALVGIEVGFGFPQLDRTLTPGENGETGEPDFEEYLHAGLFVRLKANDNFEVDTGLRGSVADLWSCPASDCWPELFGGGYVQPMIGGERLKVGARLTAGWIGETEGTSAGRTFTTSLNPFIVRYTLSW